MRTAFAAYVCLALACIVAAGPALAQSQTAQQAKPLACAAADFTNRVRLHHAAGGQQLTASMVQDLGDAYCKASDIFRYQLDSVDFIFVDATACTGGDLNQCGTLTGDQAQGVSWGMRWEGGYTQIGMPAALWPAGQHASKYTDYEAAVVNGLVQWTNPASKISFTANAANPANNPWMTVLAVMAHELGHIRWVEVNIRGGFGQAHDFRRLNDCNFFVGWGSHTDKTLEPKKRWRRFGDVANEENNDHTNSPKLSEFQSAANDQARGQLLHDLYAASQPWASYLGANAPDEDYVESYKLDVLVSAGLSTMPMTIPNVGGMAPDIPGDLVSGGKNALSDKLKCLRKVH